MIEISAADGHVFSAYRAEPADAPKGAVVVLQEVFGVNPYIRKLTDTFAANGYLAIAPCLFDRVKKNVELGYDDAGVAEGLELVNQVGLNNAIADIQAVVETAGSAGKVAIVGYDWGGYLAYHAANMVKGLTCVSGYYPCGVAHDLYGRRRIPTLLHFGSRDTYIPYEQIVHFRAARPDVSVFDYPAGHGFACEERDTYDAAAAQKAFERTFTLISHNLQGPPPVTLKNQGAYAATKVEKKKKPASDDLGPPMD
ncbi:dienelactone hydrolase [Methylocaldum marinum]|uniref:Dienelactone hydrolase n=1 Tax=Methylocaldum marinum TaxID=1432792 RepID=A0A250KXD9_9GAMM|nr:dienelactone hydrolase family protein [Methylocaldum marinum]BBA36186.1 dienelactone hydrolase [Methylocaldum marinum]